VLYLTYLDFVGWGIAKKSLKIPKG